MGLLDTAKKRLQGYMDKLTTKLLPADELSGGTKYERSLFNTGKLHNGLPVSRSDVRRLERNRYAPWGRGDLGGRPVRVQEGL